MSRVEIGNNPYARSCASYNGWDTRRRGRKHPIADMIMSKVWLDWDDNSPAHNFWKRKVKKSKKGMAWWKKNWRAVVKKVDEED